VCLKGVHNHKAYSRISILRVPPSCVQVLFQCCLLGSRRRDDRATEACKLDFHRVIQGYPQTWQCLLERSERGNAISNDALVFQALNVGYNGWGAVGAVVLSPSLT
jgi:hypothetical protein